MLQKLPKSNDILNLTEGVIFPNATHNKVAYLCTHLDIMTDEVISSLNLPIQQPSGRPEPYKLIPLSGNYYVYIVYHYNVKARYDWQNSLTKFFNDCRELNIDTVCIPQLFENIEVDEKTGNINVLEKGNDDSYMELMDFILDWFSPENTGIRNIYIR